MKYNRRDLCKAANHLASTGMQRSAAFKAAWYMVKQGNLSKVAGVTYEGRQRLLARLTHYQPEQISLSLVRNRDNPFDKFAVSVVASVTGKGSATVGFLPAIKAAKLARLMDKGIQLKAIMEGLVGGYDGLSYGMRLRVAIQ